MCSTFSSHGLEAGKWLSKSEGGRDVSTGRVGGKREKGQRRKVKSKKSEQELQAMYMPLYSHLSLAC